MSDLKTAATLALEALKEYCEHGAIFMPFTAVKALEEALSKQEQRSVTKDEHDVLMKALAKSGKVVDAGFLAKQEQGEPVATIRITQEGSTRTIDNHFADCVRDWPDGEYTLYTTPQPPQRKPLTDEEIGAILEGVNAYGTRLYTFARAIEAKLKEKNT